MFCVARNITTCESNEEALQSTTPRPWGAGQTARGRERMNTEQLTVGKTTHRPKETSVTTTVHAANAWLQFFGENVLAPLQQTRHEKMSPGPAQNCYVWHATFRTHPKDRSWACFDRVSPLYSERDEDFVRFTMWLQTEAGRFSVRDSYWHVDR